MSKIEELEQRMDEIKTLQKDFEIEINECQKALAELKERKKEGKWKPQVGEEYYYRDSDGDDVCTYWYNDDANHWRVNNLPVFKTKEACDRYWHFMDTVKEKSYEFSKEEWEDSQMSKYNIYYHYTDKEWIVGTAWVAREMQTFYFKTAEDAEYIINNFKEELLEYWL